MRRAIGTIQSSKARELCPVQRLGKRGLTSHPGAGRWVQRFLHGWECQANVPMAFAQLCVLTVPGGYREGMLLWLSQCLE